MKIAILGFGQEGKSAYRYWSKTNNQITIHDNNENVVIPKDVDSVLGEKALLGLDTYSYDLIVRSPGVKIQNQHSLKTKITTPTQEFVDKCPVQIIGITGTKGKGTTCSLLSDILNNSGIKTHLVGNIGTPALDILDKIEENDLVVYEMSSFQLYDIKSSPHVAVCLLVTEDHLDWHDDLEDYHNSKGNIFRFQKPGDIAIYYKNNETSTKLVNLSPAKKRISYGDGADIFIERDEIRAYGKKVIKISEVGLLGKHNLQNVCAAIAAASVYTSDYESMEQSIKDFKGLALHVELVGEISGIKYYNDSFSSNPTATQAAVESIDSPIVLFIGGIDRGSDFNELAKTLAKKEIRQIVLYGEAREKILQKFNDHNIEKVLLSSSNDFEDILTQGIKHAKRGDAILFSPGCPSFDMFKDFKERGKAFNSFVSKLKNEQV